MDIESLIAQALKEQGILSSNVLAYALATAKHEAGMVPKDEIRANSRSQPYLAKLQNNYEGGWNYHGRGLIQLTHKSNYQAMDDRLGLNGALVNNPDLANDPEIAARILAVFFKDRGVAKYAEKGDFYSARRPVNGTDKAGQIASTAKSYIQKANQLIGTQENNKTMVGDFSTPTKAVSSFTVPKGGLQTKIQNTVPKIAEKVQSYSPIQKQTNYTPNITPTRIQNYTPVQVQNYTPATVSSQIKPMSSSVRSTPQVYTPSKQTLNYTPSYPASFNPTQTIQAGSNLTKIAAQNKTTIGRLLQLNPQITNPNLIRTGEKIRVR